jgi:hypothetical protein
MAFQVNPITGQLEEVPGPTTPGMSYGPTPPSGTGDQSSGYDWGDTFRKLSAVLGSAAGANRNQNNIVDARNASNWANGEQLRLARDKFASAVPGQRLKDSTRASLESNYTPTTISWGGPGSGLRGEMPKISGGPSAALANLDPRTKALASTVMDDELAMQQKGGATGGGRDAYLTPAPPMGQESLYDKLIGGGSTAAGILSALGGNKGGGNIPIDKLIGLFRNPFGFTGNTTPGDGFGGPGTSTYGGHDEGFEGPIDDPSYYGDDPESMYGPGGAYWQGPMQNDFDWEDYMNGGGGWGYNTIDSWSGEP